MEERLGLIVGVAVRNISSTTGGQCRKNTTWNAQELDSEYEDNFRTCLTNLFSFLYIYKMDI